MKDSIREPKPLARLKHEDNSITEIYVLDTDDSMAMNSSTNYNHHYEGAGIIKITTSAGGMIEKHEYYVNSPSIWHWMEWLMRLGLEKCEEKGFSECYDEQLKIKEEFKTRKPYKSMHSKS